MDKPWDTEIAFYMNYRGFDQTKALTFTILRWMYQGDLRPLADAIIQGYVIDEAVLNLLARLILDERISVSQGHGRPRKSELFARKIIAALWYKPEANSEAEFEHIADTLGVSHQTVRHAVTAFRRHATAKSAGEA